MDSLYDILLDTKCRFKPLLIIDQIPDKINYIRDFIFTAVYSKQNDISIENKRN